MSDEFDPLKKAFEDAKRKAEDAARDAKRNFEENPNTALGAAAGAVIGGLLGGALGRGKGAVTGAGLGAAAGAFIGSKVGAGITVGGDTAPKKPEPPKFKNPLDGVWKKPPAETGEAPATPAEDEGDAAPKKGKSRRGRGKGGPRNDGEDGPGL